MLRNDGVLILSHKRADNITTISTLRRDGWTGPIKIAVSSDEPELEKYKARFGDDVIVFDKADAMSETDAMTSSPRADCVVYARNQCWKIADELGWEYFIELDDDYDLFVLRKPVGRVLKGIEVKDLDEIFAAMEEFVDVSWAKAVCMSQGGDFMGGASGNSAHRLVSRKMMNVYVCRSDRPFKFRGEMNEDVVACVDLCQHGDLCLTYFPMSINQKRTQSNTGGLTDIYLDNGTYVKSFMSVMAAPSCVKIAAMGGTHMRIHHEVEWRYCAAKIVREIKTE